MWLGIGGIRKDEFIVWKFWKISRNKCKKGKYHSYE